MKRTLASKQRRHRDRAFTIIELVIVMTLVAVMTGFGAMAANSVVRANNESRDATTYVDALKMGRELARGRHRTSCVAASVAKGQVTIATLKSGRHDCYSIRQELNNTTGLIPTVETKQSYPSDTLSDLSVSFSFNPAFAQTEDAVVAFTPDGNVGGVRGDGKAPNSEWTTPPPGIFPMYGAIAGFGLSTPTSEGTMVKILSSSSGGTVSSTKPALKTEFEDVADATQQAPPGTGGSGGGGGGFACGGGGGGGVGEMMQMY